MKVIVCAVAFLALASGGHSAPEDKKVVFLSLQQTPSQWLSDQPMDLYVNPFGKPLETQGFVVKKRDFLRPNFPRLDLPGPGYYQIHGAFPWLEDLR